MDLTEFVQSLGNITLAQKAMIFACIETCKNLSYDVDEGAFAEQYGTWVVKELKNLTV